MNASKFMDKQIMDLSRSKASSSNDDFIDLMNPIPANDDDKEKIAESTGVSKKKEILPNYDFQPIRPSGVPSRSSDSIPMGGGSGGGVGGSRAWNSVDSKSNSSPTMSYGYLGSIEPDKVILEKAYNVNDSAVVSEIDHTMKRHTDNLLHAIDGLSARLSQVESRTRQLEHSVDDLKVRIGNNHGNADGKMRQLENILREVQSCMQDLKDKQKVMNARMQLEKLQMTAKVDQTPETQYTAHVEPAQQTPPQQPNQQFPVASVQSLPGVSTNAPSPPQPRIHPPMQLPNQYPPTSMQAIPQQDTYFPPTGQKQEVPTQQYPVPLAQQQPPLAPPPAPVAQHHHYQPGPPTPYPQGPQLPQQHQQPVVPVNPPPPQLQPSMAHHSEEPHMPSQAYPPNLHQPPSQPTSGPLPPQQFYNAPASHMYDSPVSRSSSGFSSSAYNPPSGPNEPYPYSGSSWHYSNNPATKHLPHSSGSGGNYLQIPAARISPPGIPTASAVSSGSSSGGSGNRVPIDDVVDKVTNMGFPREHVRATVRKLTENGQPVDLNVVLDKLMKDGDVQHPKGWFGR